jgi:hypothetical protein
MLVRINRETFAAQALNQGGQVVDSYFAPAGRTPGEDLAWLARDAADHPIVKGVLASAEGFVMVLDENRQVLGANAKFLDALGLASDGPILGLRPGEVMACDHAPLGPGGCGTSRACSTCGAVLAILAAQKGLDAVGRECHLNFACNGCETDGTFMARATPLALEGRQLTVLSLLDLGSGTRP